MQIRIDEMESKQVDYGFGPKTKLNIKSGGKFYSCFLENWNTNWAVGQTVEVNIVTKEKNGKTYYNLKPAGDAVARGSDMYYKLAELDARVRKLEQIVFAQASPSHEEPPPYTDEDAPF